VIPSPRAGFFALAVLLVAAFVVQALRHVHGQDATYDERSYFGLGKVILQGAGFEDRTLVHPPLPFYVSSLPLLGVPGEPHYTDARLLFRARATSLLVFGLPLVCGVALWAYDLHGPGAALAALALAAFSPTLLAHAPLITADAALACTSFLAVYLCWRNERRWWLWGAALGLALLTKMTALLFVPVVAALALWRARGAGRAGVLRVAAGLAAAWLVLCAGYGFTGLFHPHAREELLARRPLPPSVQWAARAVGPILPLPYMHMVGRQANVAVGPWPVYLLGEVSFTGWRHYFLVALAVKETLPFLLLTALALVSLRRLGPRRAELVLLLPLPLFLLVFGLSSVQIGIRYILPALPFLFVFAARLARPEVARKPLARATLVLLLALHAASTTAAGPDFLAYFNELAGGPAGGWRYLGDSNLDWGQNVSRARRWADSHGALLDPLELPAHGLVVLSTNRLQGMMLGRPRYRLLRDEYEPVERIAANYWAYDLDRNRRFPEGNVVSVLSGADWRAGEAQGPWMSPGLDDGAWAPAVTVPRLGGFEPALAYPGTQAALMACDGAGSECAFRHEFTLPLPPVQAILYLATRGEYDLFVNGSLFAQRRGCNGGAWRKQEHHLERSLQSGRNLIALRVPRCQGDPAPVAFAEMRAALTAAR